jgi:hypothetical protein
VDHGTNATTITPISSTAKYGNMALLVASNRLSETVHDT